MKTNLTQLNTVPVTCLDLMANKLLWSVISDVVQCQHVTASAIAYGTYRSVHPGCDVYPTSTLPCWKHPAHSLAKWPSSSPTGWGPSRTRIQIPLTLQKHTHIPKPVTLRQKKPGEFVWFRAKQTGPKHRVNLHLSVFFNIHWLLLLVHWEPSFSGPTHKHFDFLLFTTCQACPPVSMKFNVVTSWVGHLPNQHTLSCAFSAIFIVWTGSYSSCVHLKSGRKIFRGIKEGARLEKWCCVVKSEGQKKEK